MACSSAYFFITTSTKDMYFKAPALKVRANLLITSFISPPDCLERENIYIVKIFVLAAIAAFLFSFMPQLSPCANMVKRPNIKVKI